MPFFGPSLAGRSNSTTGTRTLTRWAAICAPITPAPSTATWRTLKRVIGNSFGFERSRSFDADPGLRAAEQRRADVASHVELAAALFRGQPHAIDLAVVRVEDLAAFPAVLVGGLADAFDDGHAEHRLVLARVGALVAPGVLLRRVEQ